jgi:hypothetical protein
MNAHRTVITADDARINALLKIVDVLGKQDESLRSAMIEIAASLREAHVELERRGQQISKLVTVVYLLGATLVNIKVLPPELARAIGNSVRDDLDPGEAEAVEPLAKIFERWATDPSVLRYEPTSASKPRLTVVADNEVTAAGD